MPLLSWKDWKTRPEDWEQEKPETLSPDLSALLPKDKLDTPIESVELPTIPKLVNPYKSTNPPPEVEELKQVVIDIEVAEEISVPEWTFDREVLGLISDAEVAEEVEVVEIGEIGEIGEIEEVEEISINPPTRCNRLNQATKEDFCGIKGIGAKTAIKLLEGCPYGSLEDVRKLVSPAIYERIAIWMES